ncbi:Panacea domain-containing protein [Sphingobium yanoikuyae]|uniref:Panacea domain-containing protein n=1 Tax=Sphingobium yanoikuyae TaxID=13690 RepID=UPI0022DE22AB|nr:Panacea domain-containing protein [Sphingobium yanoikuyae]WBQ14652.1 Panacea domain-containing protein [Sphingobium yanoikuyae]
MAYRSTEIANEFLKPERGNGQLTQMQLQKLAFIANGWNSVINGEPLIGEEAQAWDYGPVYPELYDHSKYFGKSVIGRLINPADSEIAAFFSGRRPTEPDYGAQLNAREKAVIDHVWSRYGRLSGPALSRLTHEPGTPWFETYRDGRSRPIAQHLIDSHYAELARRAQAAAA